MARRTRITVEGKTIEFSPVSPKSPYGDFLMICQHYYLYQAQRDSHAPLRFRIRDLIIGMADRNNFVRGLTVTSLAKHFGVSKSAVSKALAKLVQTKFLEKDGSGFVLCALACWKGTQEELTAELIRRGYLSSPGAGLDTAKWLSAGVGASNKEYQI